MKFIWISVLKQIYNFILNEMNDRIKTILCFVIVVIAVIIYLVCACMPSMDELKEMFSKNKRAKLNNTKDNN